jgi:hypothetical protein
MSKETEVTKEEKALHIGCVMFSLSEVMNKKVRYKNGSICEIVGGNEKIGLLNKWESGSISGFGRLEDIEEVLN